MVVKKVVSSFNYNPFQNQNRTYMAQVHNVLCTLKRSFKNEVLGHQMMQGGSKITFTQDVIIFPKIGQNAILYNNCKEIKL